METMPQQIRHLYEFGPFRLDPQRRVLLCANEPVALTPKAVETLIVLVQNRQRVISKDELMKLLWPDSFVEESNLSQNIFLLRKALGDSTQERRYILTVPGRGYQFTETVREIGKEDEEESLVVATHTRSQVTVERVVAASGRRLLIAAGVASLVFVTVLAGVLFRNRRVPAVSLSDEDTIVLADFANSTGDAVFDDTLKQGLTVSLSQSPLLNILPNSKVNQILQQMTRPANTSLTAEISRELCLRAGSKAYVQGSIASLGSEYVLGLKAINCQTGDVLAQEQVTAARKEKVLEALGAAATHLRAGLGESVATVQRLNVPLEQATTPSLEALQAHTQGRRVYLTHGMAAAIPYFEHAIALDPNFASAYLFLGVAYSNLNQSDRSRFYVTKAYELRDRVSEREKFSISAYYNMQVTGDLDRAVEVYREWIASYPRNQGALINLGQTYAQEGQFEKAVELARRATQYEKSVIVYENIALYLIKLNRFDEASKTLQEAHYLNFDDDAMHLHGYRLAFLEGDEHGMDEHAAWFNDKPDYVHEILGARADREAYSGHLKTARQWTDRAVDGAKRVGNAESAAFARADSALREALFGNFQFARRESAAALALAPASQATLREIGLAYALADDSKHAESIANELGTTLPRGTIVQALVLPMIRAKLELDRNHPEKAIQILDAARPYEYGDNLNGCAFSAYLRGQAYLAAQQASAAADQFRAILDHRGVVLMCPTAALARLGLARSLALELVQDQAHHQGDATRDREKALAAYREFLTLWKDTDPDIPIWKQAATEAAKLQ